MTKKVEKIIAAYNSTVDQINQVDYNPPGTSVWTRGDGTRYRDPGNIVALYGKNGSRIGNKNNKEPIQAFIQWLKSHPRTKDIGAVSDWYGTSKPREALQLGGVLFTLDDDNRLEFGSPSRLRNSDVWRLKPKESMDMNESEQEYKVGDIVIALKGPHKGDKHEVIHCFDDGSCNIRPLTHRVKYRLGAAKAQPEDIQMAANEAEYNKDAVDKEIKKAGVGKKGAKNIHRLLKGHSGKKDEVKEETSIKYGVFSKGGSIGSPSSGKPIATYDSKEEAQAKAKSMRKGLSRGEREYYKMSYVVKPVRESEISESTHEFLVRLEEPASGDKTTWSVTAPDEESAVEYALRHTRLKRPRVVEVEKLRRMSTESQLNELTPRQKAMKQGAITQPAAGRGWKAEPTSRNIKNWDDPKHDYSDGSDYYDMAPGVPRAKRMLRDPNAPRGTKSAYDKGVSQGKRIRSRDKRFLHRNPNTHGPIGKLPEKVNEGVLDDVDDDGFMAKRQLYDLAKYAVELHRMIQDTDDLEPWVQAKITKAADYIDTVKHYLEYSDVRDAEATADVMGPPEMGDIDAVDSELDTMMPVEDTIVEYGDEDEGSEVTAEDVLRWAVARDVISDTTYKSSLYGYDNPNVLYNVADDLASSIGRVWEIGSSDVSIWMREFVRNCKAAGCQLDGERAHLYESQLKAKMIYRNMLRELREKKPESNIVTEDDEITNPAKEAKKKMKDAGWLNNIFIRPTKNGWTLKTYVSSFGEDEGRSKEDKVMAKAKELETNAKELLGDVKTKIAKTPAKNIKEPFYSVHLLIHIPREIKGKK